MNNLYEKAQAAAFYVRKKSGINHFSKGVITGTGLGELWKSCEVLHCFDYSEIPHMGENTVRSHSGKLYIVKQNEQAILIFSGRFHYYEGHAAAVLSFPVRLMHALGARSLLMTNVAGGLNERYQAGSIVALTDHINFQPAHVLRGRNEERWGPRFPDMLTTYDEESISHLQAFAQKEGISLHRGVYFGLQGPSLETPAEYEMIKRLGADLVGMSTVPEVLAAQHMEMKITVLSVVSNMCYPIHSLSKTTVEEVLEVASEATPLLEKLCLYYLSHL